MAGGQAIPSVQMFPLCSGGWYWRIFHVGWPVSRFDLCAATTGQTESVSAP